MATKTKKSTTVQNLTDLSRQAGLLLMSAAVTVGMLELPDRASRIVVPNQPAFAWANEKGQNQNTLRRASEETEQHYISYSVAQRTPPRSGRH
jgi:hypothetical protein